MSHGEREKAAFLVNAEAFSFWRQALDAVFHVMGSMPTVGLGFCGPCGSLLSLLWGVGGTLPFQLGTVFWANDILFPTLEGLQHALASTIEKLGPSQRSIRVLLMTDTPDAWLSVCKLCSFGSRK